MGFDRAIVRSVAYCLLGFFSIFSVALYGADNVESGLEFSVESPAPYKLKLAMKTNASKARVWSLWADVENWQQFDTLVEYSYLEPPKQFVSGAKGVVKASGSPKTRFRLSEVIEGKSFTEKLILPFYQSIDLLRYFQNTQDGSTVFVHEVHFKGRLRWLSCKVACDLFKKELPLVMSRLKEVAENGQLNTQD